MACLYTEDFCCDLVRFVAVAKLCFVDFEVWEYRDIFIAIGHHLQLCLFEVWGERYGSVNVNINQHKLINKMFAKIVKLHEVRQNLDEVTNHNWWVGPKTV